MCIRIVLLDLCIYIGNGACTVNIGKVVVYLVLVVLFWSPAYTEQWGVPRQIDQKNPEITPYLSDFD